MEKRTLKKASIRIFAMELLLFSITLFLGIATSFRANQMFTFKQVELSPVSFWQFIFQFALATAFVFFVINFIKTKRKKHIIFKIIFSAAVFFGGTLILDVWFSDLLSLTVMGFLIFVWWNESSVLIQNTCVILAIAGVGSILGLAVEPETVIFFLIFLSVYDFIAVYKTKHMVRMAKEMIDSKAILGLVIPPDFSYFRKTLKGLKPGGKFLILGGGDMVFPLLLCSSLVPTSLFRALIVAIFSLFGLSLSFYIFLSQKKRKPIPALPPIALLSIIGFLATRGL